MEQEEWLWAQAAKHGFAVSEGAFAVTRKQTYTLQEKRHPACYSAGCDLRGHSAGDGPGGFKALLCEGVGRGKAYGLGLMTIIHRGGDHG